MLVIDIPASDERRTPAVGRGAGSLLDVFCSAGAATWGATGAGCSALCGAGAGCALCGTTALPPAVVMVEGSSGRV
ncbi:MAG: hypothetical protein IIV49_03640 [Alistipes sp.]|nr:hypothetical protein [Alistipes sp.]